MRRISPDASMPASRSRTDSALTPSAAPSASYGRGTSGSPLWVAAIRPRSTSDSATPGLRDRQLQFDLVLALLGQPQHRQTGLRLDALQDGLGGGRRFGANDEPHVQRRGGG